MSLPGDTSNLGDQTHGDRAKSRPSCPLWDTGHAVINICINSGSMQGPCERSRWCSSTEGWAGTHRVFNKTKNEDKNEESQMRTQP